MQRTSPKSRRRPERLRIHRRQSTGDLLLGWDTDQFPTDIYLTTQCITLHPQGWRIDHGQG